MQRSLSGRSGIENGKNCRNMQKLMPQEFPVKKDLAPLWDDARNNKGESCLGRPHSGVWLSDVTDTGLRKKIRHLFVFF